MVLVIFIDLYYVGGHTSEMISLIKGFNVELYNPFVFVHANTDTNSMKYVEKADVLIFGIDDE